MGGMKYKTIMDSMKKSRKDYSEAIPKAIEQYVKQKFKCSGYLAKKVSKDLIGKEDVEREREV